MKVIDNKKYFELAELKKMLKQKSWKDDWGVETIYVNGFIEFLEKIEIIEEDKLIEKMDEINPDNWCWVAQNKINELIDEVNKLKKESDK
jgi:hypothetical protein